MKFRIFFLARQPSNLTTAANDCGAKLETEQVCADTSWTLWTGPMGHGPFCCQEGETPIDDENAPFGECWSSGLPVISSEIASTVRLLLSLHI
jgi:hypothetical protein